MGEGREHARMAYEEINAGAQQSLSSHKFGSGLILVLRARRSLRRAACLFMGIGLGYVHGLALYYQKRSCLPSNNGRQQLERLRALYMVISRV